MLKSSDNLTIRILLYVLIFLVIVLFFLLIFILPSIKTFRANKIEYKRSSLAVEKLEKKYTVLSADYNSTKLDNKALISSFVKDFKREEFEIFAKNFFDDVTLTKKEKNKNENGFFIYEFNAASNMKTPKSFYKFLSDLKSYKNVIKVNFPLTFVSKNHTINTSFKIFVYELNSTNE